MSLHASFLMLTVFLAAGVEVIEMATIVLGVGTVRGWPSTFLGGGAGLIVLAAIVAVFGPLLTEVPINLLRIIVGMLLLLFGLQWLRKAIFRIGRKGFASGAEEEEETSDETDSLKGSVDWTAFALSFKGVFLEGLEIAFIVVTFGAAADHVGLAVIAAGVAFAIIAGLSVLARNALRKAPDYPIKYAVGILLTSYGTFWTAEGLTMHWPGGDLAILYLLALYIGYSLVAISIVRKSLGMEKEAAEEGEQLMKYVKSFFYSGIHSYSEMRLLGRRS
jgi:uncharacterized membrane protein